ncbi:hypothetical protein ACO22_05780 [Paracoccidioides brasiliensis]|uniref:Uncharacterized protein n=1 Tax=Paracoccidioides brasiliensis TaxID=121759 RepID=A0A1D2J9B5_PARBR|nr:hypothetical protein ACO22_05780 [Paracoccidioides brasiliensis]
MWGDKRTEWLKPDRIVNVGHGVREHKGIIENNHLESLPQNYLESISESIFWQYLLASFPGTSDRRGWALQTEQYVLGSKLRETWVIPKLKQGEGKEKQ